MRIILISLFVLFSHISFGQDTIEIESTWKSFNYYVPLDTTRNAETETVYISGKTIHVDIDPKNVMKKNGKTYYILPENEKKKAVKK
jgi:hypothetical protein